MVKEIEKKTSAIKLQNKELWGPLNVKFRSLFLKITKKKQAGKESFSMVSEMHLCVPVANQQARKGDLNWTCLHTGMEWYVCEPARLLVYFSEPPEFWTYSAPVRRIFSILRPPSPPPPCVNATSLPTGFLERTRADQYKIASMAL